MQRNPPLLSKSKLLSARQCLKRLHLEIHRPELATVATEAQAAFDTGHRVGDLAHRIYGNDEAVLIPYESGLNHALRKSKRLVAEDYAAPIFEATFRYRGVLVRVDVLLPGARGWRIVEVKASTEVRDHHVFDCAVQAWVFRGLGHHLEGVAVAHVDRTFIYPGGGEYRGLLREQDLLAPVERLLPAIPDWVDRATRAAGSEVPEVGVGAQCNRPFECPFMQHCWPGRARYSLRSLPQARLSALGELVAEGIDDIREVPPERLTAKQARVRRIAMSGQPELLPGAGEFVASLGYPRYYIDFETVSPAVPLWAGTRPYETLPFQWSCHYEPQPGRLEHAEFLDLSGDLPLRRFAESLIRVLGEDGPVLVYSHYERMVIDRLGARFVDLAGALASIVRRLVDLRPVTERYYYHPDMAGSWSLKAVLPTIATGFSYDELEGIQDGTAASEGYLEAMAADTGAARKEQLRQQLLRYCRFDTLALQRLVEFFREA